MKASQKTQDVLDAQEKEMSKVERDLERTSKSVSDAYDELEEIKKPYEAQLKKATAKAQENLTDVRKKKDLLDNRQNKLHYDIEKSKLDVTLAKGQDSGDIDVDWFKSFIFRHDLKGWGYSPDLKLKKTLENGLKVFTVSAEGDFRASFAFKGAKLVGLYASRMAKHAGDEVQGYAWAGVANPVLKENDLETGFTSKMKKIPKHEDNRWTGLDIKSHPFYREGKIHAYRTNISATTNLFCVLFQTPLYCSLFSLTYPTKIGTSVATSNAVSWLFIFCPPQMLY